MDIGFNIDIPTGNMFGSGRVSARQEHRKTIERNWRDDLRRAKILPYHQVKGMQAAGLHPLWAMGGGGNLGGGSQPQVVGGRSGSVSGIRSSKGISKEEAALLEAQTRYYNELANEARGDAVGKAIDNHYARNSIAKRNAKQDQFEIVPRQVTSAASGDNSRKAGPAEPGWNRMRLWKDGPELEFLGNEPSENFENPVMFQAFMERNWRKLTVPAVKYILQKTPTQAIKNELRRWLRNRPKRSNKPPRIYRHEYEVSP